MNDIDDVSETCARESESRLIPSCAPQPPPPPPPPPGSPTANPGSDPEKVAQRFPNTETQTQGGGHPEAHVTVPGGSITITQSAEQLFGAIAPRKQLFYRGGVVVELINEVDTHTVQILDAVAAQSRFEKYVRFFKTTKAGDRYMPIATTISETVAKQYLKSEACRDLLPKLNGVLHCPLLVEKDGQLHRVEQGYDTTTGLFVTAAQRPEAVSVAEAVDLLSGLLSDFDFVTPGDRSRAIASLLTPALKLGRLITGPVPVDVAEANASQSGKTYRQRMVAALYNQKPAVVTKKAGGVGSLEETFSDHLIRGKVFIQFDNVRGKLDSQFLESFMTAEGSFAARIPFTPSVSVDPSKFILFISSNGFEATPDLTNRASIIRIRKRAEHQFRMVDGKDLVQLMFLWQPLLMGCVFAVVEEWHRRGKPKTQETRHDFREWCQVLDWIVQNLFHAAPLMDGHDAAKQRAANPNLSFLRLLAIKLSEKHQLGQDVTASDLGEVCLEDDIEVPGLSPENQTTEQAPRQIGKIIGALFGDRSEAVLDEFRVTRRQHWTRTEAGNSVASNRYTFSLVNATSQDQAVPLAVVPCQPPVPEETSGSPAPPIMASA